MKLTPWYPCNIKPKRRGVYRVQDSTIWCNCCWIDAHWDGKEWHSNLYSLPGRYSTLMFNVRRWRGLRSKP